MNQIFLVFNDWHALLAGPWDWSREPAPGSDDLHLALRGEIEGAIAQRCREVFFGNSDRVAI